MEVCLLISLRFLLILVLVRVMRSGVSVDERCR
jgi:hypothetical protein